MEILFVENFITTSSPTLEGTMENISMHCHFTPSDEIAIYGSPKHKYLICNYDSITFPKVVYVDMLDLGIYATLVDVLPDVKKIGVFWPEPVDIDDFGKIQEINIFHGMSNFLDPKRRDHFYIKTTCEPLGDDMYRFTSKKGSWDIKVNKYN